MNKMIFIVLFVCTWQVFADQEWISGFIQDDKGNITKIKRIKADGTITGNYKGKRNSISFKKLKRIDHIKNDTFRVTNLANKTFTLEKCLITTDKINLHRDVMYYFTYYYYNDIAMEEKEVDIKNTANISIMSTIKTLSFEASFGEKSYNPRTKQFFPPDYLFDPFTGEKLVWHTPGTPYKGKPLTKIKQTTQKPTRKVKQTTNNSSTKQSTNTLTDLHKDYLKKSLSPFSSSKEQIEAARKIADEIIK